MSSLRIPSFCILLLAATGPTLLAFEGDALDHQLVDILRSKCIACHDDKKAAAGSGVDYLLNLEKLAKEQMDAETLDKSYLLELISGKKPAMPKPRYKDVVWNGELTESEQATFKLWILRGGPSEKYRKAKEKPDRTIFSEQQVVERIANDLGRLNGAELKNARYLTLTNLHNNRGISAEEMEVYRRGIVKTINSLSRVSDVLGLDTSNAVNRIEAIDRERTIFRFDLRQLGWQSEDWERIAQHYPYALLQRNGTAQAVYSLTSSKLPYLRADWFNFACLQPPLYHDLLKIPVTLQQLEDDLGIKRLEAIQKRQVARAGMEQSKVSVNNRLLERISMTKRAGAYHISYDFGSNHGRQNINENPLGPIGAFKTEFAFQHDGGEVIFNLPNGFQAYALVKSNGDRLDIAPQPIVQDSSMPGSVIINGISCLSCHYQGMKPEAGDQRLTSLDVTRQAALQNNRRFSQADKELIGELYPPQKTFSALLEQDRQRFQTALRQAGIEQLGSEEPSRTLFDRFVKDLDLQAVAAEFGLTPDDCSSLLEKEDETRQLLLRINRATLKRQLYLTEFNKIARLAVAGETRDFIRLPFPYFGETVTREGIAEAKASPIQTGVDLIDAEHRTGSFQVTLRTEGDRKSYKDGESLRCLVRANEACYLTIVQVDPAGEMTLLLPNKWHPEFRIKAGQTLTLPTREMPFEFIADPPHGPTLMKVIATKRPLVLKGINQAKLTEQDGLAPLGKAAVFGESKSPLDSVVGTPPSNNNAAPKILLTDRKLEEMFLPNEWATASWTLVTNPR